MAKHSPPRSPSINLACSHALGVKHFLIWRIIICTYFYVVFIWSMARYGPLVLISLTIQTLCICTISMSMATYVTYLHYKYLHRDDDCIDLTSNEYLQCSR